MTYSVVIAWHGLPAYAARLIKAAGGDFPIIATKPIVPIEGMEALLPKRIHWIEEHYSGGWAGLNLPPPELYFQPSWCTPSFNQLGDEVRAAGGQVVVMFDNPWRGDFRQFLGAIRFRTQWRRRFVAAWVAGESGRKLARFWGFKPENIYTGMYGADPTLFRLVEPQPLVKRSKVVVFVARLVEDKGVAELMEAWKLFSVQHTDWQLHVYGTGPLESLVRGSQVVYHGFQQPEIIADAMKHARFLVLPSHLEHWGLVVCEAAQAGCGLLLSETVASADDLMNGENGFLFKPKDPSGLALTFDRMAGLDDQALERIQSTSIKLGSCFEPANWSLTFHSMVKRVLSESP